MNPFLTLGLLLLSTVAMADPLQLERELNDLRVDVEVSEPKPTPNPVSSPDWCRS